MPSRISPSSMMTTVERPRRRVAHVLRRAGTPTILARPVIDGDREGKMKRRTFVTGAACALAGPLVPRLTHANVPKLYDWDISPPTNSREAFIKWMVDNR